MCTPNAWFIYILYSTLTPFQVSCETFCVDDEETLLEAAESLGSDVIAPATVRFMRSEQHNVSECEYSSISFSV